MLKHILIATLIFSSLAYCGEPDPRVIELIQKQCDWTNSKIPLDDRMDCMTDYLNCAIVGAGETDLNAKASCLPKAAKRRQDEQRIQN